MTSSLRAVPPRTNPPAPIVRGDAQVRFPIDVQELAFRLWMTLAGGNAAATERLLVEELPGEPIPTRQTIAAWARAGDWLERAQELWRVNAGHSLYELQVIAASNFRLSQMIKLQAMTGGYAGREMEGALALKAGELADRLMERGVVPLVPVAPKGSELNWEALTTEEKQALAREWLMERKQQPA